MAKLQKIAVQMTLFGTVYGLPRCCEDCARLVSQPEQGVALGCGGRHPMKEGCPHRETPSEKRKADKKKVKAEAKAKTGKAVKKVGR